MSTGTLGAILLAAVAHALWNIAAKRKRGDAYLFVWAYTLLSAVLCAPLVIVVASQTGSPWSRALLVGSLVSSSLHLLYSLVLQTGYQQSDLSVVYPVARGVGPLLTMIIAITAFGQRPGAVAVTGAVVVLIGVSVVTGNPIRTRAGDNALRPLVWGAATGTFIAAYTLWDSYSIKTLNLEPVVYFCTTLVFETVFLTPHALRRRAVIGANIARDRREVTVVAVLSPLAYILILRALETVPVTIVAPLRESSIVVGALLACWLFGERDVRRRVAGAVVVLLGIALISLT